MGGCGIIEAGSGCKSEEPGGSEGGQTKLLFVRALGVYRGIEDAHIHGILKTSENYLCC